MYLFLSEQLAWKENNNKKIKHHLIVGAALSGKKKLVQPILTIYRTAIKKKKVKANPGVCFSCKERWETKKSSQLPTWSSSRGVVIKTVSPINN